MASECPKLVKFVVGGEDLVYASMFSHLSMLMERAVADWVIQYSSIIFSLSFYLCHTLSFLAFWENVFCSSLTLSS